MSENNLTDFFINTYGFKLENDSKEKLEKFCLEYFGGDELAASVFINKYSAKYNTPTDMHERIANNIHRIESKYPNPLSIDYIFSLLDKFKYLIPGGSVMFGLNNYNMPVSLGNCFVIGEENEKDSYGTIIRRDEEQVQLMKRRGGVGQDLSFLRGKGSRVNNAARTSTGVVPFAERYSNSIKEVAQDGRRGAGMLTLNITHPDALDFIKAKANTDKINGANISLKIDDFFMNSLKEVNDIFIKKKLSFDEANEIAAPYFRKTSSVYEPRFNNDFVFNELIKNTRNFSEPGILFWDRVEEEIDSILYDEFSPVSTNPCGELPLSPYESCRLASLNLYSYVDNPFTEDAEFNFDLFEDHVISAQRIMDDIVDLEIEQINIILRKLGSEIIIPNSEQEDFYTDEKYNGSIDVEISLWKKILSKTERGRRTGLGITAFGDMFAALGIKYDSNDGIFMAENIFSLMLKNSYKSSIIMAKERGFFPAYNGGELVNKDFQVKMIDTLKTLFHNEPEIIEMWKIYGRRNIQNLAIAPTGSISIMTQTTSGIEPVFNLRYKRRKRVNGEVDKSSKKEIITDDNGTWELFNVTHPKFKTWYKIKYPDRKPDSLDSMPEELFKEIVKESPYFESSAHEIDPIKKITLQSIAQKYIDGAISITHNLPEDVTEEQVKKLALYAWETGCKGFTIYRDNSRGGILIKDKKPAFEKNDAAQRPESIDCDVHQTSIKGELWTVLIGTINKSPYEIFAFKSNNNAKLPSGEGYKLSKIKSKQYSLTKNGEDVISNILDYFDAPEEEFITRLMSGAFRHGMDVSYVYEQLVKSNGYVTDFSKAIARILNKYVTKSLSKKQAETCPECGNTVVFSGGCVSCSCGWSKC